jgi:hypothetical protein
VPEATTPASAAAASVVAAVVEQKTAEAKPAETTTATTAQPTTPAKTEPAKTDPQPRDDAAWRLAAVARESKKLSQEKTAWSAERARSDADFKAREAALAQRAAAVEKLEALKKSDPDAYFRSVFGENYYDTLTEMRLSGKAPPSLELQAIREEMDGKVKALQAEREAEKKAADEARGKAEESARARAVEEQKAILEKFEADTLAAVKGAAEKYEFISAFGQESKVAEVIKLVCEQTTERDPESGRILKPGKVMSWEEAADAVEAELEKSLGSAVTGKKWSARQQAAAEAKAKAEQANGSAKTLTNEAGTGTGASAGANGTKDRYQLFVETLRAEQAKIDAAQK